MENGAEMIRTREKQIKTISELITDREPMVQVICLTIAGKKVLCIGPVLHLPEQNIHVGNVEDIEFGELVAAHLAAQLISGEFGEDLLLQ